MPANLHELDCKTIPYYHPVANECELFEYAWRNQLPLLIKGPTGCGKTRFVQHMAAKLARPLITVSCHDDLSAADLVGRHLIGANETYWSDGPLTRAVRGGGICYLDEIVEARKDTTVVLHPLTDDRRILPIERTGEELHAPSEFMIVVSFNPGYQNILKSLKPSTRQRFVAITLDFPPPAIEAQIVQNETGLALLPTQRLVELAHAIRQLKDHDLEEVVSTRLLVYTATLMVSGMAALPAINAGIIEPLSDDHDTQRALYQVARGFFD